jgi:polyhydroxyalkanoate synthesis regulator phasin
MAQNDTIKKLVKASEKQATAAQKMANEFITRGREQADSLFSAVEQEVSRQLSRLGVATSAELGRLEARIDALTARATRASKPAPKKAPAKKAAVKKAVAKKAPAKKAVAKKAPAKKAPAASARKPVEKKA